MMETLIGYIVLEMLGRVTVLEVLLLILVVLIVLTLLVFLILVRMFLGTRKLVLGVVVGGSVVVGGGSVVGGVLLGVVVFLLLILGEDLGRLRDCKKQDDKEEDLLK